MTPRSACALLLLPVPALAGELETFVGGGVSGGVAAYDSTGLVSVDATTTQVEADGMIGWGWGHARVDLDLHFDLNALGTDGTVVGAYPSLWPEWGMVQLGRKQHVRLGLVNPNMGIEDWDPWVNYAPTYSNDFIYIGTGRFLGADVGFSTESGWDLFAYGGYDVDWSSVGGGVGVATAQDAFATWSGLAVYPQFAGGYCPGEATTTTTTTGGDVNEPGTCFYGFAQLAFEFYPIDPLWLDVEVYPGVKGSSAFVSTQFVANVIPEAIVNPYVRGEFLYDPDGVTGAPGHTASVGARSDPKDFLRASLEGKLTFLDGGTMDPGVALVLALHRAEPSPYSFTDPFGADEE